MDCIKSKNVTTRLRDYLKSLSDLLKFIHIKGFRNHKNLRLEFDPNITTIVGENGSGKSAILRALKWICTNKPSGDEFINWDLDNVVCDLGVDEHVIKRSKGKRNYYKLSGRKDTFKGFGTKVPEPISKVLNTCSESFQDQFDSVYCLSKSPGQIGQDLNAIIDLSIIDRSLDFISKKQRFSKTAVSVSKSRLEEAEKEKKSLAWTKSLYRKVKRLRAKEKKLLDYRTETLRIEDLIEKGVRLTKTVKKADTRVNLLPKIKELQDKSREQDYIREWNENLSRLLNHTKSLESKLEKKYMEHIILQQQIEELQSCIQICPTCKRPL